MKKLFFCLITLFMAAQTTHAQTYALLPKPTHLEAQKGTYTLPATPTIAVQSADPEVRRIAQVLADQMAKATGSTPAITGGKSSKGILFADAKGKKLGPEGYTLTVSPKQIIISAEQPQGFFYGVQSLMQLMPAAIFSSTKVSGVAWTVPACTIDDTPRYGYRGSMLDAGRYFYPVAFIKKYIDLLARHKMNTFHWHLTEDQGWHIEIKKYPKLTEVSSVRKKSMAGHYKDHAYDNKPHGGFYTQDEVRDVVKYAQERFVTIIPEIEMPGHSVAVLAAYPELGSNPDKILEVSTNWGVHDDVLFPREETFTFLENVLTEVMALFPSQYIHIGGDECPKTQWKQSRFCQALMKEKGLKDEHELQSYFIQRIDKFVTSKGRRIIGWDEILEGGLSPNATVMSWRGISGGIAAARQNHDVIMSPTTYCYLDYYQADPKTQPVTIGGFLPIEKVYSFNPSVTDSLTAEQSKHVLGVQGNVWSEYLPTTHSVEYMAYPRLIALAETGWTPQDARNFDDFSKRLEIHKKRLDYLNVNYFGAPINNTFQYVWPKETAKK
ncbi:beta-N-acetylhexosaminidase [Spirosoma pollinicola]|uniref:beta-N-acetylhexosaminidase n=1 Tax=Spirosoma pollinicola TaxID=2057025 RepID=A0A2K8YUM9_9BACT|nr:beta-N-acetylhexosaminidase [Spirosoma pollinicola]AUD01289.1 beta-N-acetylglucosaminidase [Spirosoma pollinicola]